MKKLCFLMALLFSIGVITQVEAKTVSTFGDKNSSGIHRVISDTDGIVTFAADTGIKFPYTSGTTNSTLTAAMTGTTFVVGSGATSPVTLQLPAAVVGMKYSFIADSTQFMALNPNGSEIINFASLSAGDAINNTSASKGDSITLFCVTAGEWSIKSKSGTWADYNN